MANEAVTIELMGYPKGRPIRWTVADGTGLEKGTILKISSDPRTAAASSADGELFAGILAEEKVASDGQTEVAAYTEGIFDIKCTAAGATLGKAVKIAGANLVTDADDDTVEGRAEVVGVALETGGANEVIAVAVGIYPCG